MNLFWDLYWPVLVAAAVAGVIAGAVAFRRKRGRRNIALAAGIAAMLVLAWAHLARTGGTASASQLGRDGTRHVSIV